MSSGWPSSLVMRRVPLLVQGNKSVPDTILAYCMSRRDQENRSVSSNPNSSEESFSVSSCPIHTIFAISSRVFVLAVR